jgi:phospholipid/cholesterol/gamma-HCH transport system substrate-binding protein
MTTEAKVGAFVIAGLLAIAATVYFVRTTQTVRGEVPYVTYLRNAAGIAPGTSVLFGGVRVGQVTDLRLSSTDSARIEVAFAVRRGTPIDDQSIAHVGTVSLMGSPMLKITPGSRDGRRLSPGEAVPSQETVSQDEIVQRLATLLESATVMVNGLQHELPAVTTEAQVLLKNLNEISGSRNQQRIEGILGELHTMLKRESPKIAQITHGVSTLVEHADGVMTSLEPLISNANGTVDAARGPLVRDLQELERTLQAARALIGSLHDVVQANDGELAETMRMLRETSDNLRSFSETLKERPWNLIRTSQPPDRQVPR